jgi:ketosteroid isomerase-like protein
LINRVQSDLTQREREFLLSLKSAQPRWELMPVPHLAQMPAMVSVRSRSMKSHWEDDKRAILAQLDSFAALTRGAEDNAQYLLAFDDAAVLLPPDSPPLHGIFAIRAFYDEAMQGISAMRVVYRDVAVDIEGTLAIRRYSADASIVRYSVDGGIAVHTKYIDVLRKFEDARWKITAHMWNASPP